MPKFSIIVPVYNVEKYIGKCLESIKNQTYKDYEVIVVNDGSTDKSMEIAKEYNVKVINTKHVSVSEARNIGVKHATGEYLMFLDSDDFWDNKLLEEITKSLKNTPDLVRFQVRTVTDDGVVTNYNEEEFQDMTGEKAFEHIVTYHFVECVWAYAIKREYYIKEKFQFKKGMVHEDFGLTPLIIIKAKKVNSIKYIGYNYFRRKGSIMNTPDYEWTKIKVKDFYCHYLFLINEIEQTNIKQEVFKSYCANSVILEICTLKNPEYREYKKKLKEDKVFDKLLTSTLSRKIKKIMYQISPKITAKIIN